MNVADVTSGQVSSDASIIKQLTQYLETSPRTLDAVCVQRLLLGDGLPIARSLAATMLTSEGRTAPRALRSTSEKGAAKELKAFSKSSQILRASTRRR